MKMVRMMMWLMLVPGAGIGANGGAEGQYGGMTLVVMGILVQALAALIRLSRLPAPRSRIGNQIIESQGPFSNRCPSSQ